MAATKGRRVATLAGAATILLFMGAGLAFKERLWEEWWLYKLEHGDWEAKKTAARNLGEMRSARAVGPLVDCMAELADGYSIRAKIGEYEFLCLLGPTAATDASQLPLESNMRAVRARVLQTRKATAARQEWDFNWPGQALVAIGSPSVPALLRLLREGPGKSAESPSQQTGPIYWCCDTLVRIGSAAIDEVRAACLQPDQEARLVAVQMLEVIAESLHATPR